MSNKIIILFKGLGMILLSRLLPIVYLIPYLFLINRKIIKETNTTITIFYLIAYTLVTLTIMYLYRKNISKDYKEFKINYKTIIK